MQFFKRNETWNSSKFLVDLLRKKYIMRLLNWYVVSSVSGLEVWKTPPDLHAHHRLTENFLKTVWRQTSFLLMAIQVWQFMRMCWRKETNMWIGASNNKSVIKYFHLHYRRARHSAANGNGTFIDKHFKYFFPLPQVILFYDFGCYVYLRMSRPVCLFLHVSYSILILMMCYNHFLFGIKLSTENETPRVLTWDTNWKLRGEKWLNKGFREKEREGETDFLS